MNNSVQNYIYNIIIQFQTLFYKHGGLFLIICFVPLLSNFFNFFNINDDRKIFYDYPIRKQKNGCIFDFVNVQFGHLYKVLQGRVFFETEIWPWLTTQLISFRILFMLRKFLITFAVIGYCFRNKLEKMFAGNIYILEHVAKINTNIIVSYTYLVRTSRFSLFLH